jgi:hypothetical protein
MDDKLNKKDYYWSSDLSLCCALVTLGYQIETIERDGSSNRAIFVIMRDDDLDTKIKLFFKNQLKLDALSYFNNLKNLKTRIFNLGR